MALYTETVMDHFMHPRNVGTLEHPDAEGEVGNAKCGDIMKMQLQIENGIITDVRFETFGCGSSDSIVLHRDRDDKGKDGRGGALYNKQAGGRCARRSART